MITQDACAFYRDHAVYREFRGVVLDEEEGKRIAETLGDKKAVILQVHTPVILPAASSSHQSTSYFTEPRASGSYVLD